MPTSTTTPETWDCLPPGPLPVQDLPHFVQETRNAGCAEKTLAVKQVLKKEKV